MRILLSVATLAALAAPVGAKAPSQTRLASIVCFATGEQISGTNKICFYNCMGSTAAITVSIANICPITINR